MNISLKLKIMAIATVIVAVCGQAGARRPHKQYGTCCGGSNSGTSSGCYQSGKSPIQSERTVGNGISLSE